MQTKIRDAALELGFIDARPVTGHPFNIWKDRLNSIPLGEYLSFDHDPSVVSGWRLDEITIWVAIAATPPVDGWSDDCGEIGAYYLHLDENRKRKKAWEKAVVELGYEVITDFTLPDRAAAIRAGLGVHGLNGLMIAADHGSFVDISLLLIHSTPPTDARGPEHDMSPGCGNCGICIKACPTGSITENGVDTVTCLRTYMSWPEYMPEADYEKMDKRILGCDTCQHVCPKNDLLEREQPSAVIQSCMKIDKLLTETGAKDMIEIMKYNHVTINGIKRQAALAATNMGRKDLLPLIEPLTDSEDETLRKAARWATDQLRND